MQSDCKWLRISLWSCRSAGFQCGTVQTSLSCLACVTTPAYSDSFCNKCDHTDDLETKEVTLSTFSIAKRTACCGDVIELFSGISPSLRFTCATSTTFLPYYMLAELKFQNIHATLIRELWFLIHHLRPPPSLIPLLFYVPRGPPKTNRLMRRGKHSEEGRLR